MNNVCVSKFQSAKPILLYLLKVYTLKKLIHNEFRFNSSYPMESEFTKSIRINEI